MENKGLSYEQASRRGLKLIREASDNQNWWAIVDDLVELRAIMKRQITTTPT